MDIDSNDTSNHVPSSGRSVGSSILSFCSWVVLLLLVAGLLVRIFLQDHWYPLAVVYYAMPWGVIAFLSLVLVAIYWIRGRTRMMTFMMINSALLLTLWAYQSFVFNPADASTSNSIRLVYWNTRHQLLSRPSMSRLLLDQDADIITLGEIGWQVDQLYALGDELFSEYEYTRRYRGMWLLVRGKLVEEKDLRLDGGRLKVTQIRCRNRQMRIVVVDIDSHPLMDRRVPLRQLAQLIETWNDQPTLVVGDFNTPNDSVHLEPIRKRLQHGFDRAGFGYRPTWPLPFPVVQIDHVWANALVHFHSVRIGTSLASDHRFLVADFDEIGGSEP